MNSWINCSKRKTFRSSTASAKSAPLQLLIGSTPVSKPSRKCFFRTNIESTRGVLRLQSDHSWFKKPTPSQITLSSALNSKLVKTRHFPLGKFFLSATALGAALDVRRFQERIVRAGGSQATAHLLLVHDPRLKYETARLAVGFGAGSFDDDLPGVAHLFEHSAFLGSARYPSDPANHHVSEFDAFLERVGGTTNAATFPKQTIFSTIVPYNEMQPALDRLLDMIERPTLEAAAVLKEISAVDAEHRKNLKELGHVIWQTAMSFYDPPFNRFTTGSNETLSIEPAPADKTTPQVITALRKYYADQVDGCRPVVVVFSDMRLSVLEDEVVAVIRRALKDCKEVVSEPASNHLGGRVLRMSRTAYLPIRMPGSVVSVVYVTHYIPLVDEHPEVMTNLQLLVELRLGEVLTADVKPKLRHPVLTECVCELGVINIAPVRFLSFNCKFLNAIRPTPEVIELYQNSVAASVPAFCAFLKSQPKLSSTLLARTHELQQTKDRVFPRPKMETTGHLIEFTRAFMTYLTLGNATKQTMLGYIEGRVDAPLSLDEFQAVMANITKEPHVTLTVADPSLLAYISGSLQYVKHFDENYGHFYYEQTVRPAEPTAPAEMGAQLHMPECGVYEEHSAAPLIEADNGIWRGDDSASVDAMKILIAYGRSDAEEADVYLSALLLKKQLQKLSDELSFCAAEVIVDPAFRRGAILVQLRGPALSEHQIHTTLGLIRDQMTTRKIDAPTRQELKQLVLQNILEAEDPAHEPFKYMASRLQDMLEPTRLTRLAKVDSLQRVSDVLQVSPQAQILGVVSGSSLAEILDRFASGMTKLDDAVVKRLRPPPPHHDRLIDVSSEIFSDRSTERATPLSASDSQPGEICDRNTAAAEAATGRGSLLMQYIPVKPFAPAQTRFVKLYEEETLLALNRLACKCMVQRLSTHLFEVLRNEQHLGYIVDASFWPGDRQINGIVIRLQSPDRQAPELIERLAAATARFDAVCSDEELRQALADLLEAKDDPYRLLDARFAWLMLGYSPALRWMRDLEEVVARGAIDRRFFKGVVQSVNEGPRITLFAGA